MLDMGSKCCNGRVDETGLWHGICWRFCNGEALSDTHSVWWGGILCSVHVHTALINNSQVGRELNKQQWRMGKVERKRGKEMVGRLNYIWTQVKTTQYRVKIAMVSCKQVLVVS